MQLKRRIGFFSATSIVVANMIGAGIFTTSGLLMNDLHHGWLMLLVWLAGGSIAFCGALSYGELGANFPKAGGEYILLKELYHPMVGFLSGWVSVLVGFTAPVAASAIGFSLYLAAGLPANVSGHLPDSRVVASGIIVVFTLVHTSRLEVSTGLQNMLTLLKIAILSALVVVGFGYADFTGVVPATGKDGLEWPSVSAMGLSLMWVMYSYSGWNASVYIGSEIRDPLRNLPRSLLAGTLLVVLIYLLMNVLYVASCPASEMKGEVAIAARCFSKLAGRDMGGLVAGVVSFALLSSLSAYLLMGPRVIFAMAVDGFFFRFAGITSSKGGVPWVAVLFQGALAVLMVWLGTFEQLLTYMGFSLAIFPILTVAGSFIARLRFGYVALPGFPFVQVLFIAGSIFVLMCSLFERPVESVVALGSVVAGIPFYYLFRFRKRLPMPSGNQ